MTFPKDFAWGTATSQRTRSREPSSRAVGRGKSIWDTFASRRGRGTATPAMCVRSRPSVSRRRRADGRHSACNAYRFSVSWPRVQPDGRERSSQRGLDFYDRLVDQLLEHGIAPLSTLYHWDLPQALEDAGGWLDRETAYRFADYAGIVHARARRSGPTWTP